MYFLLCVISPRSENHTSYCIDCIYDVKTKWKLLANSDYFRGCHSLVYILTSPIFVLWLPTSRGVSKSIIHNRVLCPCRFVYVPLPTALDGPPNDGHGHPRVSRVTSNSKNCTSSDFGDGVTRFMVVCD
jgi:hypothetical protein